MWKTQDENNIHQYPQRGYILTAKLNEYKQKMTLALFCFYQWEFVTKERVCKGIRTPGIQEIFAQGISESGKLFVKYRILSFGFQNTATCKLIWNETNNNIGISFKFHRQRILQLDSGIHEVESRLQYCHGFPYLKRTLIYYWYGCQEFFLDFTEMVLTTG